ncbi:MAG: ABC transporter ATP-binding protein [Pirellula sp.]
MATSDPPFISIDGITKRYHQRAVLDQLSLVVHAGEWLVVLGESGCGKSTLLKTIAGLVTPDHGSIRFGGMDQSKILPHQRDVSIVFQSGNGYDHLTVHDNLLLSLKHRTISKSERNQQLQRWVDDLKLGELLEHKLPQLSGGQAQKVAIARAFLSGKSLVLLDEPLAHLDQVQRAELREVLLRGQLETRTTMVYVTHDSDDAMVMADRIAILSQGAIRQHGTPRQVFESPTSVACAQLLGVPAIQWIELPALWFDSQVASQNGKYKYGVRPHVWSVDSIQRIERADSGMGPRLKCGLIDRGEHIELFAQIQSVRWLGDRWLICTDCPPAANPMASNPRMTSQQIKMVLSTSERPEIDRLIRMIEKSNRVPGQAYQLRANLEKSRVLRLVE